MSWEPTSNRSMEVMIVWMGAPLQVRGFYFPPFPLCMAYSTVGICANIFLSSLLPFSLEGDIADIGDGTMFIGLQRYQQNYNRWVVALRFVNPPWLVFKTDRPFELLLLSSTATSPYKLCFGPKSFLVISDPVQARHILRDANTNYDKGVLAEILKPIMVGRVPDI